MGNGGALRLLAAAAVPTAYHAGVFWTRAGKLSLCGGWIRCASFCFCSSQEPLHSASAACTAPANIDPELHVPEEPFDLLFCPNGAQLLSFPWFYDPAKSLRIWNLSSGKEIASLPLPWTKFIYAYAPGWTNVYFRGLGSV